MVKKTEVGALHVEAERRDGALLLREVRENRGEQPFHRAGLRRETRDTRDVEVRRFRPEQEVGVEENRRGHRAGAVEPNGDPRAGARLQIRIHAQRHRHVRLEREVHRSERHGLQRIVRDVPQHRGLVQPNLRAARRCLAGAVGRAIGAEDVVQRRLKVGVAEPFDDDAVDARDTAGHGVGAFHAHNRTDSDRRIERGPEMELVRRVGAPLGGDDPAQYFTHGRKLPSRDYPATALRYSSQSRMP